MKDCTYYDLLGVPRDATDDQIVAAKNFLAKKFHPDANMDSGFDTTTYIQNVLHAYRILSDPKKRSAYDRRIDQPAGRRRRTPQPAYAPEDTVMSPNFAPYWEAANKLNELVEAGGALLKPKHLGMRKVSEEQQQELSHLASEADVHIRVLDSGSIPQEYWFSHAMNWLLFQWSQHRNLSYAMLFSMYDSYVEQHKSALDKKKIQSRRTSFLSTLEKMMEYQKISE